jgi:hypothetical protein
LNGESDIAAKSGHVGFFGRMRRRGRFGSEVHVLREGRKELGVDAVVLLVLFHDGDEELKEQCRGIIQADAETHQITMPVFPTEDIPLIQCKSNDAIATRIASLLQ